MNTISFISVFLLISLVTYAHRRHESSSSDDNTIAPISCPMNCKYYYDGCNWCSCDGEGNTLRCTEKSCSSYGTEYCHKCSSNFVWNDCGNPCWQDQNCTNTDNDCTDTDNCEGQCECPSNSPLYDAEYDECISEELCDSFKCPDNCVGLYYDGCNNCTCDKDTGYAMNCTELECAITNPAQCFECSRNLEWSFDDDCLSCWDEFTCNDKDGPDTCDEQCVGQCECPQDTYPYYDKSRRRCLSEDQCDNKRHGFRNRRHRSGRSNGRGRHRH